MKNGRLNKGKPAGDFIGLVIPNWTLYQTGDKTYKVCATEAVEGKANYSFGVSTDKIDSHLGLDYQALKMQRPDLFDAINAMLKTAQALKPAATEEDDGDPYGDIAMTRRRKLSKEQQFKRGMLLFRRVCLELATRNQATDWEVPVRMLHKGIFKETIEATALGRALAWISARSGPVSLELLLQVEQDYYEGKYAPNSSATLEGQLAMIAGGIEPIPMEATNERVQPRPGTGPTVSDNSDPFADFR